MIPWRVYVVCCVFVVNLSARLGVLLFLIVQFVSVSISDGKRTKPSGRCRGLARQPSGDRQPGWRRTQPSGGRLRGALSRAEDARRTANGARQTAHGQAGQAGRAGPARPAADRPDQPGQTGQAGRSSRPAGCTWGRNPAGNSSSTCLLCTSPRPRARGCGGVASSA